MPANERKIPGQAVAIPLPCPFRAHLDTAPNGVASGILA
jgi:hypothetical protein